MKIFRLFCGMIAGVGLLAGCVVLSSQSRAAEFYVATNGSDSGSGTARSPFATLEKARDAVRIFCATHPAEPVTVLVRGGSYALARTLKLETQDSGSPAAPVVWRAYKHEQPCLLGGHAISNFVPYTNGILKTRVDVQGFKGIYFRQLFFNGQRQHLARYPNFDPQNPYGGGWAYADGQPVPMYADRTNENRHTLQYKLADTRTWSHPEEGEVFIFPRYNWWNDIVRIKSVERETHTITLAGNCSYAIRPFDRYYVQNLLEELDTPGEWYLDKRAGTLYFWPPSPLRGKAVYAPTLRTILEIGPGTANVTFRGFTFECAEGTAIALKNTTNCIIAASTIRNVGDYHGSGVSINGGRNNGVVGCDISEIGSHGIDLNGGDRITLTPAGNYADNNYIHHVGVFYKQGVGIMLGGCGNRASHNLIHDGPRMGIMFAGNNLIIEYNHIRHMNLETEDTGAVYTGGRDWIGSRGSVIRYNYFHDMLGYGHDDKGVWHSPHFAWGVYLDDNTGGVDVIGNIIARCSRACIHLHNGRDNLVRNNIFIEGRLQQIECNGWNGTDRMWRDHFPTMVKGYESVASQPAWATMRNMRLHPQDAVLPDGLIMSGNVFLQNIVAFTNPQAHYVSVRKFPFDHNFCDSNLVWHGDAPLLTGEQQVKAATGPNLVLNGDFEDGEPGKLPVAWKWQVRPNDSQAALDASVKFGGRQALRLEGRGTSSDAKHQMLWPNFVSTDIAAKTGQYYRLTARIRASEPDTKFAMLVQSYIANVYFWAEDTNATAGTDWKEYELVFKFPAPGDHEWHAPMQALCVRFDIRQPHGTIWVDDVTLRKATLISEWEAWQARGMDQHSMVADPLFVNAARDDYRLKANSPAFQLGFEAIPVEKIGPYPSALRASWPIVEAAGARERPLNQTAQ